jgi:hypothetical protein
LVGDNSLKDSLVIIEGITRVFAQSFDGECAEVGNLTLHLSENSLAQMLNLPQTWEKWFKNRAFDAIAWDSLLSKNRQNPNWVAGVPRTWFKEPWRELIFFIQKYITCEGHFSLVYIYHIIIFAS